MKNFETEQEKFWAGELLAWACVLLVRCFLK